jgi:hypothetical protein
VLDSLSESLGTVVGRFGRVEDLRLGVTVSRD